MNPHPRIRKTVKWGGAVVAVLLVIVWIGSGWWYALWGYDGGLCVGLHQGTLLIESSSLLVPPDGFEITDYLGHSFQMRWWLQWVGVPSNGAILIPLWMPCLISSLFSAFAWRADALARRRERLNLCAKCRYDRTGLAAGAACPECGVKPEA